MINRLNGKDKIKLVYKVAKITEYNRHSFIWAELDFANIAYYVTF